MSETKMKMLSKAMQLLSSDLFAVSTMIVQIDKDGIVSSWCEEHATNDAEYNFLVRLSETLQDRFDEFKTKSDN
jgi:hypothetical protein